MDEELLKQVQLLTDQVKTLAQTQEAMISRQDQLFKSVGESSIKLQQVTETLETTNEALLQSLSENDSALDDLATISAGLVQATQQLKSVLPQSMQQQQQSGLEGSNV